MIFSRSLLLRLLVAGAAASNTCGAAALGAEQTDLADSKASDWLSWKQLPPFPNSAGIAHAFIGTHGNALVVAGGVRLNRNTSDSQPQTCDGIYTLVPNGAEYRWTQVGRLASPLAEGAAVSSPRGVVCVGGRNINGCSSDVLLVQLVLQR